VGALSDERTVLYFVYVAGTRQRSLSWVRVPLDSWPYFTVSDLRLPFSSPPTTRRVTVEVLDPASWTVCCPLKRDLADWIKNTYFDTAAASVFVSGETAVKVVTVYYLRVAAWTLNCLGRCLAMDVCSDSDIEAFRQHATILNQNWTKYIGCEHFFFFCRDWNCNANWSICTFLLPPGGPFSNFYEQQWLLHVGGRIRAYVASMQNTLMHVICIRRVSGSCFRTDIQSSGWSITKGEPFCFLCIWDL
jgi:hypothetical protein